jgi:hypothetical protein
MIRSSLCCFVLALLCASAESLSAQVPADPAPTSSDEAEPTSALIERILTGEDGAGTWDALAEALSVEPGIALGLPRDVSATTAAEVAELPFAGGVAVLTGALREMWTSRRAEVLRVGSALLLILLSLIALKRSRKARRPKVGAGRGRPTSRATGAGRWRSTSTRHRRSGAQVWSQDAARLEARLRVRGTTV